MLKHLRRWKEERDAAATVQAGLSEAFVQAAMAEIGSHVLLAVERFQQQLSDTRREADETLAELEKGETRFQSLEAELAEARDQLRISVQKSLLDGSALGLAQGVSFFWPVEKSNYIGGRTCLLLCGRPRRR